MPVLEPVPDRILAYRRAVGERIRRARDRAGITQEALGKQVDLARNTISNIELGRHSPRLDSLAMIAEALGVTVHDLLCE